jgi:hypothetical protein
MKIEGNYIDSDALARKSDKHSYVSSREFGLKRVSVLQAPKFLSSTGSLLFLAVTWSMLSRILSAPRPT